MRPLSEHACSPRLLFRAMSLDRTCVWCTKAYPKQNFVKAYKLRLRHLPDSKGKAPPASIYKKTAFNAENAK